MINWSSFDEFSDTINKYMQPTGEGDTKASQIVTAVNKLIYKWYNDGDVYSNQYFLQGWANDLSDYANWLYKYVPESKNILAGISDCHSESDYSTLLYELAERCLDIYLLDEAETQPKVGSIYNCDGPFEFIEYEDEDDEYYDDEYDEYYDDEPDEYDY